MPFRLEDPCPGKSTETLAQPDLVEFVHFDAIINPHGPDLYLIVVHKCEAPFSRRVRDHGQQTWGFQPAAKVSCKCRPSGPGRVVVHESPHGMVAPSERALHDFLDSI